jgi:DNA-binding NtrC family response regulator
MAKILLIDDDADLTSYLHMELQQQGHQVQCLDCAERGPEILAKGHFEVVLLDNKMPGMSGIDFLAALQQHGLGIPVILMTGHGTTDTVIQAMNLGAFDYVVKPLEFDKLIEELEPLIDKAVEITRSAKESVRLPGEETADSGAGAVLLGKSKPMQEVYKAVGKVARSDAPVLIHGETGTGKELIARAIHANSPRRNKPFVAMNCTALNENLLDDELFGHEAGAFTGAEKLRKGRFEYANGGTLFLDEVGDMPATLQAKLLRVLENQEVLRVGSNEALKVNVRVLSATHRHLESAIRDGTFREDLYYRLAGVTIRLPALRERGGDIAVLAEHFLATVAESMQKTTPTLHENALEKLQKYSWPGNVRQLQNVMRRAFLMCRGGTILPADLEFAESGPAAELSSEGQLSQKEAMSGLHQAIRWALNTGQTNLFGLLSGMLEKELLQLTLAELDGNQAQVAKRLGIARGTVIEKMRKYGLK